MSDTLKINMAYGGLMSYEDNKFNHYSGGFTAAEMLIDPDFLTWSTFQDFTKKKGILSDVKKVWYKLPSEDMSAVRPIYKDKDNEILKMCSEAKEVKIVDVYIEHGNSMPCYSLRNSGDEPHVESGVGDCVGDDEAEGDGERINAQENNDCEHREDSESEKEDSEHEEDPDGKDIQSEGEDQILGEGAEDARFEELLSEPLNEIISVGDNQVNVHENEAESESDDERPIRADEYPDSPVETDDEWDNWNKKDESEKERKPVILISMTNPLIYGLCKPLTAETSSKSNCFGRGRPKKAPDDGNTRPPKRRKKTQSQSSFPTSTDNATCPAYSSAPTQSTLQSTNGSGRGRGRPPGPAKKAVRKETIPRGFGCYISPFTNRIFDVRGNRAVQLGGSNQMPSTHPSSQGLPRE